MVGIAVYWAIFAWMVKCSHFFVKCFIHCLPKFPDLAISAAMQVVASPVAGQAGV